MSTKVSNAMATIVEWIFKIILLAVAGWLISSALHKFDEATFDKIFVGFTAQIRERLPHLLTEPRARIDSTFYTNSTFYVDMTLGNDIRNQPPVEKLHSVTRQFFETTVRGPDRFSKSMIRYNVKMVYRFSDASGIGLSNHEIPVSEFEKALP
ncbi:MAG: hypothetical protein LR011_11865 [Verrucomicrobia bacterium]|nr:hypothetical protein [Verrucomicrobiota bacterium]